jgi:EmrB/QacA subfamily drug resistance transporter
VIPPQDRGKVQGVFAAVFSISSVVGPLLGGWFVDQFTWHWIFFINIPLGLVAAWTFWISFHPKMHRVSHKIDWMGAVTLSVSLASLTLVTTFGGRDFAWLSVEIIGLGAIALVFAVAFIMVELRASEPIVPLELFKLNVFWVTSIIGFISGAAMFGAITFLPLYLQIAKGVTPTQSGLMLIPMTFGILFSSTIAGQTMSRLGKYYYLPIAGMISLIFGMYLLTNLEPDTSTLVFSLYIMTVGFGMGFIFPVVTTAVQNAVPKKQLGAATASGLLFRQVGGSLGVAVFGALFTARMTAQFAGAPGGMGEGMSSFGPQMVAGLPEAARSMVAQGVVEALHPIYFVAMALAAVGLGFAFILKEVPLTNRHVPKGE